jgi:hypothetical protein
MPHLLFRRSSNIDTASSAVTYLAIFYQLSRLHSLNNAYGCGRETMWYYLSGYLKGAEYLRTSGFLARTFFQTRIRLKHRRLKNL